jgi:hypothetical protein
MSAAIVIRIGGNSRELHMPRLLVLTLFAATVAISGCQSPSAQMAGKPCNPRMADAGYCYGIALPPLPGR